MPDLDARLVAENIVAQLERRIYHSRAMKRAVRQAMRAGAQGCQGRVQWSSLRLRNGPAGDHARGSRALADAACGH
jgi:hypothetical protein